MSGSIFRSIFQLGFQASPIVLTGGVAAGVPGQMLPIMVITEGVSIVAGALSGSFPTSLDQLFAQFTVIPNATLISQVIAHYPLANQAVASNAVITQPLKVSVRMDCPANSNGAYVTKIATLTALQAVLSAHNASGGLYTVVTPSLIYTNCLLENLSDISSSESRQVQYQWQFDFEQPLVTLQAAQQAYSGLLNKISSGTQMSSTPSWSGPDASAGGSSGNASSAVVSGSGNLTGSLTGNSNPVTAPNASVAY